MSEEKMKVLFMEDEQTKIAYGCVTFEEDFIKVVDGERKIWINKKNVVFIRSV